MAPVLDFRTRKFVAVCARGHREQSFQREVIAQWCDWHSSCSADGVASCPPARCDAVGNRAQRVPTPDPKAAVGPLERAARSGNFSGTARSRTAATPRPVSSVTSGTGTFDGPSAA